MWDVPWEDIFKLGASSEFCEWFQLGIDVYVPHQKYQVKLYSSPRFSSACAAAVVPRNLSESKVKFRQASNHYESVN